jgi:hypothetical protein
VAENPAWRHAGSDSTTTKSTTAKSRTKSRNRDIDPTTVSVFRLVANKFLCSWQYDNLLLACTAALSRTASDAPENRRTYLRICQVVQRCANSVSRAKYSGILGRGLLWRLLLLRVRSTTKARGVWKSCKQFSGVLSAPLLESCAPGVAEVEPHS